MKLPLRSDWKDKISEKIKVYPVGTRDRQCMDKMFDKLHNQGYLEWTKASTPFSFPVFVIWKTDQDNKPKGQSVVDIQSLNDILIPDAYPLPAQSKIIANLQGCTNISVLDAASFFYQWQVHPDYHHMLTIVTYCGQETFNVPVMGCKNSVAYIQRSINNILRPLKEFVRVYIDDIVSRACFFSKHVVDLQAIFDLCIQYNILIKSTKVFLNYPSVNLLN